MRIKIRIIKNDSDITTITEEIKNALTEKNKIQTDTEKLEIWKSKNNYKTPDQVNEQIGDIFNSNPTTLSKSKYNELRGLWKYKQPKIPDELLTPTKVVRKKTTSSTKPRNFNYVDPEKCKTNMFCIYSNGVDGTIPKWEEGGVGGHLGCKQVFKRRDTRNAHKENCKHKYRKPI